jgi:hypothetical protein
MTLYILLNGSGQFLDAFGNKLEALAAKADRDKELRDLSYAGSYMVVERKIKVDNAEMN